jgi:hypothetical protein
MGGSGSGSHYHWWRATKKTVVEDCLSLDANRWAREGILRAGVHQTDSWRWVYQSGRECSIGYEVFTQDMAQPLLRLSFSCTARGQAGPMGYHVRLATTRRRFGGLRWWFLCPLSVNGRHCCRRVGKLYLPPGSKYFGCRHCHDLTYQSAQEHDKRADLLRRHPELIDAVLDGTPNATMLGLGLKALRPRLR